MYDLATRKHALSLIQQGLSLNATSKQTGISRAALRSWQARLEPLQPKSECPRSAGVPKAAYAYLLGLYLGDGCVSRLGRTYSLRIACADAWPGLIEECERAMLAVRPANRVGRTQCPGCVAVTAYSNHWPCLFPQHGPGRKHERRIALEPWQQAIVDEQPWALLRGLIHSDGSRIVNWTTRVVGKQTKRYEYPRYFFTNRSTDILRICTDALDHVGVAWRLHQRGSQAHHVSVARKASVALMDEHVGPKY